MLGRLLSLLPLCSLTLACESQPLDVATGVQLERFQGKWYEIAKLPRPSQADCTKTTATYSLKSQTELLVLNECWRGKSNGYADRLAARAVVNDPDVPAKLSLNFGFAYGDYWILEVGEDYQHAVIGHPTREYLWIMSRTPELEAGVLSGAIERAHAKGFPTALLDYTDQH